MLEVLRQEKKFLITKDQYYSLSRRLYNILREDSHSSGDGYVVRSLYFDTLYDGDFEEKEDGTDPRRKIRLRNYGADTPFGLLEMKQKQSIYQKKRSLKIDKADAIPLTQGDYSPLLKYKNPYAGECYALMNMRCYRPVAVITYTRKVFIADENKIRITFDHDIMGTESNFDIFQKNLPENYILDPYLAVLEIKYNGFLLSYIKDFFRDCAFGEIAVSKYCMGRMICKDYIF